MFCPHSTCFLLLCSSSCPCLCFFFLVPFAIFSALLAEICMFTAALCRNEYVNLKCNIPCHAHPVPPHRSPHPIVFRLTILSIAREERHVLHFRLYLQTFIFSTIPVSMSIQLESTTSRKQPFTATLSLELHLQHAWKTCGQTTYLFARSREDLFRV